MPSSKKRSEGLKHESTGSVTSVSIECVNCIVEAIAGDECQGYRDALEALRQQRDVINEAIVIAEQALAECEAGTPPE